MKRKAWSDEDRQLFADGNILKAKRIPDKRKEASKRYCRNKGR
jgi:hypothetical protein